VTPAVEYRRVLLVEDDASLNDVIGRNLARRGLEVRTETTVSDALRAVAKMRPDLILLDINLPDRSGWELLRALHGQGIEIPTIIISATRCTPERLIEFKPVAFLPKPFPLDALLRLVVGGATQTSRTG
jgi:DNA-binding response OmpR family regulator